MGLDVEEDLKRKMIDLNIAAGRKAQSPQTGYVHLNYASDDRHDTIPLFRELLLCPGSFSQPQCRSVYRGQSSS